MPSSDSSHASAPRPGTVALDTGWQLACTAPGAWGDAAAVRAASLSWLPARVPGTVAHSLGASIEEPGLHDAHDWWYRCEFAAPVGSSARTRLRFEGLATLAEVWLNGEPLLQSDNMFVPCSADVGTLLAPTNELLVCLRSLDHALKTRRPRPRWKTSLVPAQNLRHVRTTLLGRMPGWNPPVQPVGVWKPVWLDTPAPVALASTSLQTRLEGRTGRVTVNAGLQLAEGARVTAARWRVGRTEASLALDQAPLGACRTWNVESENWPQRGQFLPDLQAHSPAMGQKDGEKWTAAVDLQPTLSKSDRLLDGAVVSGSLTLPDVPLWWPHTHGKPVTMPCQIDVQVDGQWHTLPAGHVGFRDLRVERGNGLVQFQVNGEPVFCRGACWTTDDLLRLHGDESALRRSLELARDAGLNMLRVGGTMAYESDAFYTLCDELGILVWQDFMFANMDYPVADEGFLANITREAEHQLQRLQTHPCVAAYCGSSEIEQQAAMLGLPASEWSNPFFDQLLPALCARWHAGVPYFRSSPSEGALPFHVATGIAHYYGVGAYKRPLADVKSAGVKFASECLGFSHVPDPETIALMMDGSTPPAHHPLWKARQPRDVGAGWDFEDTRDHYLRELFGVDAVTLRSHDPERYLAVSRVVPGEVMRRVFNEWRSPRNVCHGGIVWFWKDVWPGAGWGVVDSTGRPKASYWHLKRAWSPRSVGFTDEGLDGLHMHVVNEPAEPLEATLEFALYQHGRVQVASASAPITVPARGALTLSADALLGRFADTSCAYRFGPPPYDVAVVRLRAVDGALLSDDFHFPQGHGLPLQHDARLSGSAERMTDGRVRMTLQSETFVQSVSVECDGFVPNDAYFHLAPRTPRELVWHPSGDAARKFKAHVSALNLTDLLTLRVD